MLALFDQGGANQEKDIRLGKIGPPEDKALPTRLSTSRTGVLARSRGAVATGTEEVLSD